MKLTAEEMASALDGSQDSDGYPVCPELDCPIGNVLTSVCEGCWINNATDDEIRSKYEEMQNDKS